MFFYQGKIGLQLATGPYVNYGSSIAVPPNRWTHVAISVNRMSGEGRIWINGVSAAQFSPLTGSISNSASLSIGGHMSGTTFFKGELDELTIYNRALTWPEVRTGFLAGAVGKK